MTATRLIAGPKTSPRAVPANELLVLTGVVARNPKDSTEPSLPLPAFDTFELVADDGRSWDAYSVAMTSSGWRPRAEGPSRDLSSGMAENQATILRPGDYFTMSSSFYVDPDVGGLQLRYRPLRDSGPLLLFTVR